jgi:hypothetical protein
MEQQQQKYILHARARVKFYPQSNAAPHQHTNEEQHAQAPPRFFCLRGVVAVFPP